MIKKNILELSEEMANLIAAGEVVERPSSVVKELVENSLDAEATRIIVELEDSGLKKIIITDNGYGMTKEEIPVALKRHATSKIANPNDLFNITTLGFRGEALPSIASVSKLTITSSTNDLDGYRYSYVGGNLIEESPSALKKGTKIEVCDLFYNTPARLKHLSSLPVELSHIVSYLNRQAIARPDIAFKLINNGKTILQTSGDNSVEEIISETFGIEVAKNMIPFDGKNDLYAIHGLTTSNAINRSNRNGINLIINGRIIKNLNLTYAITNAYETILPLGKYPITILEICCDPSLIDVNVHPSKLEIRFTDEYRLRELITKTIAVAITKRELINEQSSYLQPSFTQTSTLLETIEPKKDEEVSTESLWEMFDDANVTNENNVKPEANNENLETTVISNPNEKVVVQSLIKEKSNDFFKNFVYIGQFLKTYLLMEYEETLYLIDQHAAMERYMYEKISKALSQDQHESFELLIPIKLEYNISTINLIISKTEEFHQMGIILEAFGPTTIIIREVPTWIPEKVIEEFLRDIINEVINDRKIDKVKMYDNLAKMLSCKKSIKANMAISELEVHALMKKLDECNMPFTCPHGRPTVIKFTKYELEKMFKRVM